MVRLLLILGGVLLLVWWFFGRRPPRPQAPPCDVAQRPVSPAVPQELVACAHCGLRLPLVEALPELGEPAPGEQGQMPAEASEASRRFYCCEAHRQAGPAGPAR